MRWNKKPDQKKDAALESLLRQALVSTEKPDENARTRLISALNTHKKREPVSLWWLPATVGTLPALAALPLSYLLRGSVVGTLLCCVSLFLTLNSWILTVAGLKAGNLKEASTL